MQRRENEEKEKEKTKPKKAKLISSKLIFLGFSKKQ